MQTPKTEFEVQGQNGCVVFINRKIPKNEENMRDMNYEVGCRVGWIELSGEFRLGS
jgi:hypothetical protein